ncbi:MAG TPA: hypothetical protein VFL54_01620 [Gammaproteobacteria bacterium]|nr:hypothetical protein [Gammaproteobacteria bacterium]
MAEQQLNSMRQQAAELAGEHQKTAAVESKILAAAIERMAAVDDKLAKLKPRVHLDEQAEAAYQALTHERGRLELVIARARGHIGA